jgi:hypothetical protein
MEDAQVIREQEVPSSNLGAPTISLSITWPPSPYRQPEYEASSLAGSYNS